MNQPLSNAATVSREETQKKLDLLAAGALKHMPRQSYTVVDRFEELAARHPERCFLIWEGQRISYGEANRMMNRVADLAARNGLQRGDTIAVMLENRPEFLYVWLGLAKIGCVASLINSHLGSAALKHAIAIGCKVLFIGSECTPMLVTAGFPEKWSDAPPVYIVPDAEADCALSGATLLTAAFAGCCDSNPPASLREGIVGESPFCLVFTSGTTGLPKAAIITHMRWLGVGDGWYNLFGHSSEDVFYGVLPLYHVAVGMSLLSQVLACGGSMVLRRHFSATKFWSDVRSFRVTVTQYSGEMCRYLVNQPARSDDRQHRLKMMAGAGLGADIWEQFQNRFGVPYLIEGYGGTEVNCSLINLDGRVGSCGRIPFKDRSIARLVRYDRERDDYIRDATGHVIECEAGEVGELLGMILNLPDLGAGRFDGYTDRTATEAKILRNAFQDGDAWFRTGDLFRRDDEDYYYFVDRIGDTFRWKSENISTIEVANALAAYPGAQTVTVYGVSVLDREGRAGMAAIVLQEPKAFDPAAFFRFAAAQLPKYAVPVFVRVQSHADITSTFKLRKINLQREGFECSSGDPIYIVDRLGYTYVPVDNDSLQRLLPTI